MTKPQSNQHQQYGEKEQEYKRNKKGILQEGACPDLCEKCGEIAHQSMLCIFPIQLATAESFEFPFSFTLSLYFFILFIWLFCCCLLVFLIVLFCNVSLKVYL